MPYNASFGNITPGPLLFNGNIYLEISAAIGSAYPVKICNLVTY